MSWIKILGTSGGRFVLINQLRKSAGIWLNLDDTNLLIDPGPGTLTRCRESKPKLNPRDLDAIVLTHKHLDHSNDVNIMIEAMTNGGWDKKGVLFAPGDAINTDPVILKHFLKKVDKVIILDEKKEYQIGNIIFNTPVEHVHGVETYGLNLLSKNHTISIISDTKFFEGLEKFYNGDILIINVVMYEGKNHILHLDVKDAEKIIATNKPKLCVITHFGMTMIKAKPWKIAEKLSEKTGVKVIAASDGMKINLDEY
jgi:phosphoribosyl 1,2-cyclic phosphodiesterase